MNEQNQEFLAKWQREKGRPLRVLHIGNIANNAYNNAKIQRLHGIEADVVCYDYYHIMGTPEWEDAEINAPIDASLPDWWSVDLGDWQRPDWFIQGPLQQCIDHLAARQSKQQMHIRRTKAALDMHHWELLEANARSTGKLRTPLRQPEKLLPTWQLQLATLWIRHASPHALSQLRSELFTGAIAPRLKLHLLKQPQNTIDKVAVSLYLRRLNFYRTEPVWVRNNERLDGATHETQMPLARAGWKAVKLVTLGAANRMKYVLVTRLKRANSVKSSALELLHKQHFSSVDGTTRGSDLKHAQELAAPWGSVLKHYDIVQGYSTDGIIPLLNDVTTFTAYEHGTLREIPFEPTTQGRLCWLTYSAAPRVFVTNSDVLPSVERLAIPSERVVYLPHAFNDKKLRNFRDANPKLRPPDGPPVFFSPTRHHWKQGNGSWLKGNDVFLNAAGVLAANGREFSIILVEWGSEVEESKALIRSLGFADKVTWISTLNKRQLWKAYCECHTVVDQFTLPAIGGVAFETLALGQRLMTRIDAPTLKRFFGAAPPVLNGATVEEVAERMLEVLEDPSDLAGRGAEGRGWIETYHSSHRVVSLQVKAYQELLEGGPKVGLTS